LHKNAALQIEGVRHSVHWSHWEREVLPIILRSMLGSIFDKPLNVVPFDRLVVASLIIWITSEYEASIAL
jgi:hypothetical protein